MKIKQTFTGLFLLISLLTTGMAMAQKSNDIKFYDDNNNLIPFALAGGLNAPQFSEIDLNNDSVMDLFVFDREGEVVLTFLNNGSTGKVDYTYAPEYEKYFPEMSRWVLLRDYNNDGKNDIFTYHNGGIKVFKNTSTSTELKFTLKVFPYLLSNNGNGSLNNLYVSPVDLPAIEDIDSDGDIDVLSFGLNSDQVSYYENFSADSGSLETFRFHDNTYCWGNFREEAVSNGIIFNASCPKFQFKSKGNKHGGATIMAFDPDGDGDMDITLGDPTFTNLVFLENGGSNTYANMVSQDTLFPSYDVDVDLKYFPAAYFLDVNNDGLKDLIVAPNTKNGIVNFSGVWYYKNVGTPANAVFSFVTNAFLQDEMIDLGSWSYPVFYDHNFDGLLDIVIGNGSKYDGSTSISSLTLFENTGTLNQPEFTLIDEDYADISQYNLNISDNKPTLHLNPAFGDLNSDGSPDLLIGDFEGRLHHFQNQPKNGKSDFVFIEANYKSIYKGNFGRPFLIDLNEDLTVDIVIGRQNGLLNYYENKGSTMVADFDSIPNNTKLGNVSTTPWNEFDGFSQPRFYRANKNLYLLSGSIDGRIRQYGNIKGNLTGTFTQLDTFLLDIDIGNRSHVEIGDLDNDGKFEILAGNSRGGISLYYTDLLVGIENYTTASKERFNFKVLTSHGKQFNIIPNQQGLVYFELYGITGKLMEKTTFQNHLNLDMNERPGGIYLIRLNWNDQVVTKKIINIE